MGRDEAVVAPVAASLQRMSDLRQVTLTLYVLYAVAPFTAGLSAWVAVVINHLKRAEVRGTFYESHFDWQVRLFWWSLLWLFVGYVTLGLYHLGLGVFLGGVVWYVYRLVRGLAHLRVSQPIGQPPAVALRGEQPLPIQAPFTP